MARLCHVATRTPKKARHAARFSIELTGLGPDRELDLRVHDRAFAHRRSRAKRLYRFVLIVCTAAELDLIRSGLAASGVRRHVMELQKTGFTAAALAADERAAALITRPDDAPDCRGNPA